MTHVKIVNDSSNYAYEVKVVKIYKTTLGYSSTRSALKNNGQMSNTRTDRRTDCQQRTDNIWIDAARSIVVKSSE